MSEPSQTQETVSNEAFEALIDLLASDGLDQNPSILPGNRTRPQANVSLRDPSGKLDFDKIRTMFAAQNETGPLGDEKNRVQPQTVPHDDGDSEDEPTGTSSRLHSTSPKPVEHPFASHRRSSTFGNQPWAAIHENAASAKVVRGGSRRFGKHF